MNQPQKYYRIIAPFLVLALLCLVYAPLTFDHYVIGSDTMSQMLPWHQFMSDCFHQHIFPYWCPYSNLGYPFYADPQSGLFYPVSCAFAFLFSYDLYISNAELLFHILFAAIGMHYLLRSLRFENLTSWVFGAVYAMSGPFIAHPQHLIIIQSLCWVPFVLGAYSRLWQHAGYKEMLLCAIFLFLNLTGGYMGINFILVYVLTGMFLVQAFLLREADRSRKLKLVTLHLMLVPVLAALSAGFIYAVSSALPYAQRNGAVTIEAANSFPISYRALLTSFFGFTAINDGFQFQTHPTMRNLFIGFFPVVLLAGSFFSLKPYRKWWWAAGLILSLLMALGDATPVRAFAYHFVPLMNLSRHTAVFRAFSVIAALLLAAEGFEQLLKQPLRMQIAKYSAVSLLIGGCVLAAVLHSADVSFPFELLRRERALASWIHNAPSPALFFFNTAWVLLLLLLFALFFFKQRKAQHFLLAFLLIADSAVVCHYTFFESMATEKKLSELYAVLKKYPHDFPVPANDSLTAHNQYTDEELRPILWQANGFLKRHIPFDGYNGFELRAARALYRSPDIFQKIRGRNLAGCENGTVQITSFSPDKITLAISSEQAGSFYYSQFYFPGWRGVSDGGKTIELHADSLGFICGAVPKGSKTVTCYFEAPLAKSLWILSLAFFFLAVVFCSAEGFFKGPAAPLPKT